MRAIGVLALIVACASADVVANVADPILTTLNEVKTACTLRKWDVADTHVRHLGELVAAPERASARDSILPVYHFYAAFVAFERKDQDRARDHIRRFLGFRPDATLDPAVYPKQFRSFFEVEQKAAAESLPVEPAGPQAIQGGVLPQYADRNIDESTLPVYMGGSEWIDTPVRHLLRDDERKRWNALADDDARRQFVNEFWSRLDPSPETSGNEYQVEFYRRVQYADANFSTEDLKGSLSDRGKVFLVFGPPTYVGKAHLTQGQDIMNYLRTTEVTSVSNSPAGSSRSILRVGSDRSPLTPGESPGDVETWYYRRERLPAGIPFTELEFRFITHRGYGTGVLQKESRELLAISKMVSLLRK